MNKNDNGAKTDILPKKCCFCEKATIINDEDNVLCCKKGIVNKDFNCRRFSYDPLKRVPRPLPPFPKLTEDDLVL